MTRVLSVFGAIKGAQLVTQAYITQVITSVLQPCQRELEYESGLGSDQLHLCQVRR